ncbi:single-stranded DNA-binding protein [Pseudomonas sp. S 311-6]|nr:single-stranded DNA-binding protein [Pseudomonas sp. S 311-6]
MASVNKVIIVGNLGRDPEVRYSADGAAICNVSVATTSQWKDKGSGERKEETEWHRVVFYGRLAEIAGEYLKKGRSVYLEGRLKTRKWTDKENIERFTTEIVADQMQMLGGREEGGGHADRPATQVGQQRSTHQRGNYAEQSGGGTARAPAASLADMDDDVPF